MWLAISNPCTTIINSQNEIKKKKNGRRKKKKHKETEQTKNTNGLLFTYGIYIDISHFETSDKIGTIQRRLTYPLCKDR
jgi:hypothetical protein